MHVTKAIIPCAGYGTRLLPVTKYLPKELLPIGNKPAIQYIVEEAAASGIREVILVCHRAKLSIADYFRPDRRLRRFLVASRNREALRGCERIESLARITVVYQTAPRGLGDAVLAAQRATGGEPCLVMLPDDLVFHATPAARQLLAACRGERTWGIMLRRIPRHRSPSYGIVQGTKVRDRIYRIRGAVEKPAPAEAPSCLGILGRYVLPPEIFPLLRRRERGALGEIQLTDALHRLAQQTPGCGVVCRGAHCDVGTTAGLLLACNYVKKHAYP